jgi:hypothetical protein
MSVVAKCDICKTTVAEDMDILEVKEGNTSRGVKRALAAHVCDDCWKQLEIGLTLHKLVSAGFKDLNPPPPKVEPVHGNVVDIDTVRKLQGR